MPKNIERQVEVFDFPIDRIIQLRYRFLTDISVVSKVVGEKGFNFPEEIPEGVYDILEDGARQSLYQNLCSGKYRRINQGVSLSSKVPFNLPVERFHNFASDFTRGISIVKGKVYPCIRGRATALGYVPREVHQSLEEGGAQKNLFGADELYSEDFDPYSEADNTLRGVFGSDDELDGMLNDSEEEMRFARFSTIETRGEHPQIKTREFWEE